VPDIDDTTSAETTFLHAIDQAIDRFVSAQLPSFEPLGDDVIDFFHAAAEFVTGGKRLRASFVRAGWLGAGGESAAPVMVDAAAAIELLQGSALVHDDLMDDSDTRRGRPSVHRDFEGRHRDAGRVGDAEWFGRSTAVLMGDLLLSWSNELIVDAAARVETTAGRRAVTLYDRCKSEVAAGQFLDVVAQTRPDVSVEEAMLVARYKSAKYTVERPLQIGAALAGGDALLEGLSAVALPLGVAFQLRDDVLGVFGDPEVTGKPAGDDLREGKRTVLVGRTLELVDPPERSALLAALGTDDGVEEARALIGASGALEAVEADIAELEAEADAAIDRLSSEAQAVLRPLALRATRRAR